MSTDFLRQLPLFAGMPDADLDRLCAMAEPVALDAGQVLMEEGSPGDALYIPLDGRFEIRKRAGERDLVIATRGPGDILGEISLLEASPRSATVRSVGESHLLKISRDSFEQLLTSSSTAALAVVRTVIARLRNTELMLRQSEKMAALGTLSAGLAHELNNPAAAVRRGSGQLREAMAQLQRRAAELGALELSHEQARVINNLRRELPARSIASGDADPLGRSDAEGELQTWLEEQGADDGWELAPPIVSLGWGASEMQAMTAAFAHEQRPAVARWLATACSVYVLLDEVGRGSERISEIVKAVKSYSYLDQAPVQLVDVHEGLENTLVILRHKLKQGVTVVRDYAAGLPRIEAYASELNQVWTNIIDNAIDAMDGRGEIRIRTSAERDAVAVEIGDNGPGIPPEIQGRLFDAFFTTKPPGVGSGLGLHIAYNIVANQHRGNITVRSRPGETIFRVTLPVQMRKD